MLLNEFREDDSCSASQEIQAFMEYGSSNRVHKSPPAVSTLSYVLL